MLQSPQNKVIVSVKSKYIKDFGDLTKRISIEDNTSVHLEDLVNIVGTVESLPVSISNEGHYKDYSLEGINVGDTVLFSFSVIYDLYQKKQDVGEIIHRNRIQYRGKEYWLADITKIFGVITPIDIQMVNGYVMAEQFEEDKIFMQPESRKSRKCKSSVLMHIGRPKVGHKRVNAEPGDLIYYNPLKVQKYQINGKPFIILNQSHILGRVKPKKVKQVKV